MKHATLDVNEIQKNGYVTDFKGTTVELYCDSLDRYHVQMKSDHTHQFINVLTTIDVNKAYRLYTDMCLAMDKIDKEIFNDC